MGFSPVGHPCRKSGGGNPGWASQTTSRGYRPTSVLRIAELAWTMCHTRRVQSLMRIIKVKGSQFARGGREARVRQPKAHDDAGDRHLHQMSNNGMIP